MLETNDRIILDSTEEFIPQQSGDVIHLSKGSVDVYVVPWLNGRAGNHAFLCTMEDTDRYVSIPSLVYKDENYKSWRIAIKARTDDTVLAIKAGFANDVFHERFLSRNGISTFRQEGFERSLVEYYNTISVKNAIVIEKERKSDSKAKEQVANVIKESFAAGTSVADSENPYYTALSFICRNRTIPLTSEKEIINRCGDSPDIFQIGQAAHLICRKIVLERNWYSGDIGSFIGKIDNTVVACVPMGNGRYGLFNCKDKTVVNVTQEIAESISPEVTYIGRTLPLRRLSWKDIITFCKTSIPMRDLVPYIMLVLIASLIGVLLPTLNRMVYDDYIPIGKPDSVTQICILMLSFMLSNVLFTIVKNLFGYRISSRVGNELQDAAYHRLFFMPQSFFREYDSADLAKRIMSIGEITTSASNTLIVSGISALFSTFYLFRMFADSARLAWIGLGAYLVYIIFVAILTFPTKHHFAQINIEDAEASSKLYQYLNGIDKIRMAGAEERAILAYMTPFARQQRESQKMNRMVSVRDAVSCVISSLFCIVFYLTIVKSRLNITVGSFVAFTSAFGAFTAALNGFVNEIFELLLQKDLISRCMPLFETAPETDEKKELPGTLSGAFSFEHVSFAYDKTSKNVINDLNLSIKQGEYVGIVGSSGCGKSTFLKLLLGFEDAQTGMISIDGKDIKTIDKGLYRKQLGVVLQNGMLIAGSIYDNITITAPNAGLKRVNEVIAQVGLAEDISKMPMGVHTMLDENSGTISGGQKQRILIARAIIGVPRILVFDEATSALDNLTQAEVSRGLDAMNVTRIVVAHRLSTIKHCDRILVFDNGTIVEEGTYDKLMQQKGHFYALATRQIAE